MSEQVKPQLVWLPDGLGGGEHVHVYRATDYDALHAEAEALRHRIEAADEWATGATQALEKKDAEIEAARGLLRDMRHAATINPSCQFGMVNPCRCMFCVETRVNAFLTATPAPEVRCHTCDGTGDVHRADGEWLGECHCAKAEQGELQEAVTMRDVMQALESVPGSPVLTSNMCHAIAQHLNDHRQAQRKGESHDT